MGVEVFVQNYKGATWTGAKTLKHKILYIPRQIGRLAINFYACHHLMKQLEGKDFNIVHSNSTVTPLGRYVAQKRGVPHLYHIREYGDKDFGLRYFPTNASFHRYLRKNGIYSICITKDIQQHHGLSDMPSSRVIYNGIIDDTQERELTSKGREYFLYAGRIEQTKGLFTLIMAYKSYREKTHDETSLPLMVAGKVIDELYMKDIQDYIDRNNLNKNIQFLGNVTDMPHLYQHAKAIIIPSEFEGFGRCMPEAMSYGCIAIAHNTGGSKEQFDNGLAFTGKEIGYRYSNKDELTEELFAIHNMPEQETTEMRQRAYQCVCKLYSFKTYVNSVIDFYKDILANKT